LRRPRVGDPFKGLTDGREERFERGGVKMSAASSLEFRFEDLLGVSNASR